MKTLVALACILFAVPAMAQEEPRIDPVRTLGIDFGTSLANVLVACAAKGLTIEHGPEGKHQLGEHLLTARGGDFMGMPAEYMLRVDDEAGLTSVAVDFDPGAEKVAELFKEYRAHLSGLFGEPEIDATTQIFLGRENYTWWKQAPRADGTGGVKLRLILRRDDETGPRVRISTTNYDLVAAPAN